jgi:hypothetical protein
MPQTSQAQLREELSKALKDAKSMFDDGLVDEKEYGDLKQHELAKYKAAVATLAAAPPAPRSSSRRSRPAASPSIPICTSG